MFKYGTFSRLFGTSKTTPEDSDTSASGSDHTTVPASSAPAAAAAQTEPSASSPNKRCLRISLIVMLSSGVVLAVGLLAGLLTRHAGASDGGGSPSDSTRPNIVFIMTDDQDRRLGSTDYMTALHRELIAKGTEFTNHYTTQALCCPARSSLLRGQQIHNTNITNVVKPGWVLSLTHLYIHSTFLLEYARVPAAWGLANIR